MPRPRIGFVSVHTTHGAGRPHGLRLANRQSFVVVERISTRSARERIRFLVAHGLRSRAQVGCVQVVTWNVTAVEARRNRLPELAPTVTEAHGSHPIPAAIAMYPSSPRQMSQQAKC